MFSFCCNDTDDKTHIVALQFGLDYKSITNILSFGCCDYAKEVHQYIKNLELPTCKYKVDNFLYVDKDLKITRTFFETKVHDALEILRLSTFEKKVLYIYYCGHSVHMHDTNNNEIDKLDETICFHSSINPGQLHAYSDDELYNLVTSVPMCNLSIFFTPDCNYSGTLLDLPTLCKKNNNMSLVEISASQENQKVTPGLFTRSLLNSLYFNKNTPILVTDLHKLISMSMYEKTINRQTSKLSIQPHNLYWLGIQ